MHRILIIAYYFPPWGMGGVQRVAKFAKYLPEYGWDVTVIAPGIGEYHNQDASLLAELPKSVRIERVDFQDSALRNLVGQSGRVRPMARWLASWRDFPDRHTGFADLAVKRARELMCKEPFDVVLTSSPPPSVHLAGLALKRDIPWIADFRDPWQALADDYGPTLFHRLKNSALHQRILRSADAVLAATPELRKHFENDCRGACVSVIRNGYDESDFASANPHVARDPRLHIVIPGTFGRFSDPRPLLLGLVSYRAQLNASGLTVTHVGASMDMNLSRLVAEAGLADIFEDRGYVDHSAAIQAMLSADVLLVSYTDSQVIDVSVPGRIYEMLRAQRPIVAVTASTGALANLLAPLDSCEIVEPKDTAALASRIASYNPSNRLNPARPVAQIRSFERREQARQLSELCHEAIDRRAGT